MQTIETARLRLVPPSLDHAEDIFAYGSRPEFVKHLGAVPQKSVDDAADFLRGLIADNEAGERLYWAVEYRGRIVGTLGFIFHGLLSYREAEFGYGFSPEVWGTGIAAEAAKAVLAWGAKELRIGRYRFYTRASNSHAIAGVRKLGFEPDWTIPSLYSDGEDCAVLRLTVAR